MPSFTRWVIDVVHSAAQQGQHRCRSCDRCRGKSRSRHGRRRELYREAVSTEPRSAVGRVDAIRDGAWRVIRDEGQYPLAQVGRRRNHREQIAQDSGVESAALAFAAYLAVPDVPLNPPA